MKHRVFIAVDVPEALHPHITQLQSDLETLHLPVSWELPQKLHLTLNFLGRLETAMLAQLALQLRGIAQNTNRFLLTPAFLETLYRRHDRSLIYLGFLKSSILPLLTLQKSLNQALALLSLPQQTRFLPHIALGQLRRTDPTFTKRYLDLVSQFDFRPLPSFSVDHITLYESLLSHSGSQYRQIQHHMLK